MKRFIAALFLLASPLLAQTTTIGGLPNASSVASTDDFACDQGAATNACTAAQIATFVYSDAAALTTGGGLAVDAVDAITEIATGLKSGLDGTLITGTAGTAGNCLEWDANGDAVDAGAACGVGAGSSVDVDGVTVTSPDFISLGDLDAVLCTAASTPDASCLNADEVLYRYNADSVDPADVDETADYAFTTVSGKQDRGNVLVSDDDCTGDVGKWWYDTTDLRFEFCEINSGTPTVMAVGSSPFDGSGDPIVPTSTDKDFVLGTNPPTLVGKFEVGGDADQPQAVIDAHTTQTDSILVIRDSSNAEIFTIDDDGSVSIGGTGVEIAGKGTEALDIDGNGQNITLGDGGVSNYIQITDGGVMSFVGTGDVNLTAKYDTFQYCVPMADPTATEEWYTVWRAPVAITITEIYCEVTGGTSIDFDFEIDDGAPTGVNGSDITCTTSGTTDGTLAGDVDMAIGDRLDIDFGTESGTNTQGSFCIKGTIDD